MKNAHALCSFGVLAVLAGLLGLGLAPGWAGAADPQKVSDTPGTKKPPDADKSRGGGTGRGTGTGTGQSQPTPLTPRDKRMLRWHLHFDTKNGDDYLNQLRKLGVILAIPTKLNNPEYRLIRDLGKKPAPLLKEDVGKIQRIYWIDDSPENVRAIMTALGHPKLKPIYFIAFMPEVFEKKLLELETAYRKKHFPKLKEDQINLTKFKLRAKGKELEPYIVELKPSKK